MTKAQFVKLLTQTLQENYPVTEAYVQAGLEHQLAGNEPRGFMGMVIKNNLAKCGPLKEG